MPEQVLVEPNAGQLKVVNSGELREELGLVDPTTVAVEKEDPELLKQAQDYAEKLMNIDAKDFQLRESGRAAVEGAGRSLQQQSAQMSGLLQMPLKELASRGADGGEVAKSLLSLKMNVKKIDPHKYNFSPSLFKSVGEKIEKYFSQYQQVGSIILGISNNLSEGRERLLRDNETLKDEQIRMREITLKLEKLIRLLCLVDKQLEAKIGVIADEEKKKFIQEELLFTLRQTIMDRQQQLAVNQQGILTFEIIIRNNRELIRGVNRAQTVTVSALNVAVATSIALTGQEIVLKQLSEVNAVTSEMIRRNAELLRTQGVDIHKQASSAMLEMDKLKSAFTDINAAMEDISRFRQEALPQMANTILELDRLTGDAKKSIEKMEKGDRMRPAVISFDEIDAK